MSKNLEEAIQAAGNPVKMLRNSPLGPYVYPVVPSEFSNWREEQRAWKETCVLFNQSYHMADMWIKGPDAIKLLSDTGINSVNNFTVNKAKQFVGCNYDGYVIGDAILFYLDKDELITYIQSRYNIFYLPLQDSLEKKMYGLDIKYFGAVPLFTPAGEDEFPDESESEP